MTAMTKQQKIGFEVAIVLVVAAAILYCSWPLGFWLNPAASKTGLASDLGAFGQPYDWFFIASDIISGVLLVVAAVLLTKLLGATGWRKVSLILLAVYGVAGAIDASLPLRCIPALAVCGSVWHNPWLIAHGVFDILGSLAILGTLLTEWLYTRRYHPTWLPWVYVVAAGGLIFGIASLVLLLVHEPGYWAQRYYLTLCSVWVASLPSIYFVQQKRSAV